MDVKQERIITSIYLTKDLCDEIDKMATKNKISRNEQIRIYLQKELKVDAYRDDIDFIRKQIREELDLMLKPQVNRLAKLIMRIGMMTISMCYFTSKIIFQFVPFRDKVSYEEMMSESKRKAAAYLNMRDHSLEAAFKEFDENN